MKLSYSLPAILSLSAASATSRGLHEKVTDLSNGAVLGVDIVIPAVVSSLTLGINDTTAEFDLMGNAHVGKGVPDVAYIYIIDSSGSTDEHDGDCGTTLDCVQAFFEELHNETMLHGSAELVAVIDFDDEARVVADFQDPGNSGVLDGIHGSYSDGGTACSHALETAALLVHKQKTAGTTVVIFAGDGECNGGFEDVSVVSENITEAADLLGDTGAIVHSIAVGDNVDCAVGNDLKDIPRNGGSCFSIPEPKALPGIIDDLIGTELTNVEFNVDGGWYSGISGNQLPQDGAVTVNFQTGVALEEGSHEVCVRVTGNDSLGGVSQAVDCHTVEVKPFPTPQPTAAPTQVPLVSNGGFSKSSDWVDGWMIFFIVAGCIVVLAAVSYLLVRRVSGKEADRAAAEEEAATQPEESQEPNYHAPQVV